MKSLLLSIAMACCIFYSANAQTIDGTYTNKWESPSGEFVAYTLTLNPDDSFTFNTYKKFLGQESEKRSSAKGTWKIENYLLVLTTDVSDIDNEVDQMLISNLNNSKARYFDVSARKANISGEKPSLKFYQSALFYAKNMALYKQESSVSSID